ncbi:MAG: CHAT domain-containing protein [Cyanobacteria bacterium J06632_3]
MQALNKSAFESIFELAFYRRVLLNILRGGMGFWAVLIGVAASAQAQNLVQNQVPSVSAADDGTGTLIQYADDTYTIEAGSLSADGLNQFHSFEQFGLTTSETANFIALPSVSNIIGRVNRGQASIIHGLLSVTSNANSPNLYLMNPAGVLFGESARLNLPGSLTVTTADGIGFGLGDQQRWLSSNGTVNGNGNYDSLTGTPTAFQFLSGTPGSIVNNGDLQLTAQKDALLLGGIAVNTGHISAAGGSVTLAAVEPNTLVRVGQSDRLLSFEIPATSAQALSHVQADTDSPLSAQITPLTLSALLSQAEGATELVANADGTFSLRGSDLSLPVEAGDAIASGNISVNALDTPESRGGDITVLGDRVSLVQANLDASGQAEGGQIRVGGDLQGSEVLPTASRTLVDNYSQLTANAVGSDQSNDNQSNGTIGIGNGGSIVVWSDRATGFWGSASANAAPQGGDGGFIEISGKEQLIFQGDVSLSAPNGNSGTLLFDPLDIVIVDGFDAPNDPEIDDFVINAEDGGSETFFISEEQLESLLVSDSGINLLLQANRNITIQDLSDNALSFSSGFDSISFAADADNNGVGSVIMNDTNDEILTNGADLDIRGANLQLGKLLSVDPFGFDESGNVNLLASDQISVGSIDTNASSAFGGSSTPVGAGGNVTINAQNQITTGDIVTEGDFGGGDVFIRSDNLPPTTGIISTLSDFGTNGTITLLPENPNVDLTDGFFDPDFDSEFDLEFEDFLEDVIDIAIDTNIDEGANGLFIPLDELSAIEQGTVGEFSSYFEQSFDDDSLDIQDVQLLLFNVAQQLNNRTAIISVHVADANVHNGESGAKKQLELIVLLPNEEPQKFIVPGINPDELKRAAKDFRNNLLTSVRRGDDSFMQQAQLLHRALVKPVEKTLQRANIDTVVFSMDSGLRMLPLAALHDGEQYLVEKYSVGMVPSLSLIDAQFDRAIDASRVLAMGASSFDSLSPLPGVPVEVDLIRSRWPGATFLNEEFTLEALIRERSQTPYELVHLATHAEFKSGDVNDSYIQLWDSKLRLGELSQLGWDSPTVDLLVLSACSTAVGSREAEMGFAGLAIGAGVRSAMASIWSVSDLGTLALMGEFYSQLDAQPIKAEALRSAQLSMLNKQTQIVDGDLATPSGEKITLPDDLTEGSLPDLSHPYYWSGFTMIGSPW